MRPASPPVPRSRSTVSGSLRRSPKQSARHPQVTIRREEVLRIPDGLNGPVIIATGPLTSEALSAEIATLVGAEHLYLYDAISPIVLSETIDRTKGYRASRWGRSLRKGDSPAFFRPAGGGCGVDDGEGDYLNCPFTRDEYQCFYDALVTRRRKRRCTTSISRVLRRLSTD